MRFVYDDTNLYVAVTCFQPPDVPMVLNELTQDFNFGQSDALNLVLDTLHDRRSGFMFMTNPGGARRDGQLANDGETGNIDWDGVWDVKVTRNEQGWIAEYMIPFKTLRFTGSPNQEWGFNLTRAIRRINEESHWAPIPIRFRATRVSLAQARCAVWRTSSRAATSTSSRSSSPARARRETAIAWTRPFARRARGLRRRRRRQVQPDPVADARCDVSHRLRAG